MGEDLDRRSLTPHEEAQQAALLHELASVLIQIDAQLGRLTDGDTDPSR